MICEFFWDFDGTLFDTYPRMARAMARALTELGYDAEYDWVLNGMKRSLGDAARAANARFGVDAQTVMDAYHRHAEDEGSESMRPYPGAREVLAAIAQGGGRNYLYTHRNHTALEALERWGYAQMVPGFCDQGGRLSQQARAGRAEFFAGEARARAENCAMVGDRPIDLQAGENAGMAGIFFDPEGFYPEYPARWRFDSFARMLPEVPKWLYDR